VIDGPVHMDQVPMAVHALFLISRPWVEHRPMGQHCTPLIRDIKNITVTFLTLTVLHGSVRPFTVDTPVIGFSPLLEMDDNILEPVQRLGIEKIKGILGRGQVAVHAVRHKSLPVIDMGRGLPGIVCRLDFVTGSAELRCRRADHGVIHEAEERKTHNNTHQHPENGNKHSLHKPSEHLDVERKVELATAITAQPHESINAKASTRADRPCGGFLGQFKGDRFHVSSPWSEAAKNLVNKNIN